MRDMITPALALSLLGRLATAQSSDADSPRPECSILTATPFDAIAFPLKDGEGILAVVAGIIDNVTVASEPIVPGNGNGNGNAKRHYPVRNTKLLEARQQDSGPAPTGEDEGTSDQDMPPSVVCAAHETCIATYAGNAFCYDSILSTFHDILGTTGSVVTGDYELADGEKGNYYTGPHPTVVSPVIPSNSNSNSTGSAGASGTTRAMGPTSSSGGGSGFDESSPVDRTGHAGRICAVMGTLVGAAGMVAAVGNLIL